MSKNKEDYWVSAEDYTNDENLVEASKQEFFKLPILNHLSTQEEAENQSSHNRRDFLKYLGFSIGAATIAASCETPIRKAIPYITKPEAIVPGIANYYATTYVKGNDVLPIVVKTREGRPIKVEGNTLSTKFGGGTSARSQASVLDLYDNGRLKSAGKSNGKGGFDSISWEDIDQAILSNLNPNSSIRIVSNSNSSPSRKRVLDQFKTFYPNTRIINYDPVSSSAILQANELSFNKRVFPSFNFSKAQIIVSFGADFLGTWVSPTEFAAQWAKNRKIKDFKNPSINQHIQYESNMSYTGSNADNRILIKPSEQGAAICKLYDAVADLLGAKKTNITHKFSNSKANNSFKSVAKKLVEASQNGSGSLVISDSNNIAEQLVINQLNLILGNYGKAIDIDNYSNLRQGIDKEMVELLSELKSGSVQAIFFIDEVNPAFDIPESKEFLESLAKVKLKVSLSSSLNETASLCDYLAPSHHFLESWGDAQPYVNIYTLLQPTISPLYKTRYVESSFLNWAKVSNDGSNDFMQAYIQQTWASVFSQQKQYLTFAKFWQMSLHNGLVEINKHNSITSSGYDGLSKVLSITKVGNTALEAKVYEPLAIGAGAFANNPWLQELPDPITRSVWNSLIHIPIKWNGDNDFDYYKNLNEDGLFVNLKSGDNAVKDFPIVRQFGQMDGTIAFPLGYGRKVGNASAKGVGNYTFDLLKRDVDGNIQYNLTGVEIEPNGGKDKHYASVQHHHTLGVRGKDKTNQVINVDEKAVMSIGNGFQGGLTDRSILRFADLSNFDEKIKELKEERAEASHLNSETLYSGHDDLFKLGHQWGLSIDLSSCIGCGACQVACVSENNIPVVGKHEVHRHHEMTWLRIDRYYYGDVENPNVFYQPMMCQHCENAPCENVCPVNATNHSSEGLNQMAYNRCVGTRYCANNCPYKVRRFNWFDYTSADLFVWNESNPFPDGQSKFYEDNVVRMVLNPDVTVRSRGVIEKCSLCVQRIQEGKLRAKMESRRLKESDLSTACMTACPTGGIVMGDQNMKDGNLIKQWNEPTTYFVLEEINTRSSVGYKMKVTNKIKEVSGFELNS